MKQQMSFVTFLYNHYIQHERMRSRFIHSIGRRKNLRTYTRNVSLLSTSFMVIRNLASRLNADSLWEIKLFWNWLRFSHTSAKTEHISVSESEGLLYGGESFEKKKTATNIKQVRSVENTKKTYPVLNAPWRRVVGPDHRFWSLDILADYISLKESAQREEYWNITKSEACGKFLPTILVQFFHATRCDLPTLTTLDLSILGIATDTLTSQGLRWNDVEDWAYIITAECPDIMTTRLCESYCQLQSFILFYILRQDLNSVYTLEKLKICVWDLVLGRRSTGQYTHLRHHSCAENSCSSQGDTNSKLNFDIEKTPKFQVGNTAQESSYPRNEMSIELQTFMDLARLLLRNSRRIWPALMVNVAQMTSKFARLYVASCKCDPKSLDSNTSRNLCYLINNLIVSLSYMSNFEPYVLIMYNWESQKTLLKLAAEFHPALILSQASYRAIIQVLAAHQKTHEQRISVLRRSRGWPPWPIAQHGMDIHRLNHEGLTQVVLGVSRLKEAGYRGDWFDDALRILGGQEFDGTPSIQTRKMLSWPTFESTVPDNLNPNLWAARVTATRDVHEAWSAFTEFRKKGGQPNEEMFMSMFKKLTYEMVREGRRRNYDHIVPGDGLEVLPVPENNYSDYYRRHLEPPSIEALYSEMLAWGIVPRGHLLSFLVRTSRTPDECFKYLRANGLSMDVLRSLASIGSIHDHSHILSVPLRIFSDFLYLICRFVPRLVLAYPVSAKSTGYSQWTIHHLKKKSTLGLDLDQPLKLAAYLLSVRRPSSCQPWYSFFRALTRERSIISWEFAGYPKNDILAWKVLRKSFNDFSNTGLHLNSRGFTLICHGFNKYMRAVFRSSNVHQTEIDDACTLLKKEFGKLTKTSSEVYNNPIYYQTIRGVHLHAYVRCLALVKDYKEVMSTLEWMSSNSDGLEEFSSQEGPNGKYIFRRVLIVIGICLQGTCFENRARLLISNVKEWGGWPENEEIEMYKRFSPKGSEIPISG